MEIKDLIRMGIKKLDRRKYSNPPLECVLLLAYLLDVDKTYIYIHNNEEVPSSVEDKYFSLIDERRKGYPIQYILKEKEFMGISFYIEEGVLIPRPDTEVLVQYVLDYIDEKYKEGDIKVVELGTGSGCISLSIAYYNKNVFVYSVDIDKKANAVAEENSRRLKLSDRVKILEGDLFQGIKNMGLKNSVDIIVSNPPYIPEDEIFGLQDEIKKYEPLWALDGGEDGLNYYRRIIPQSKEYLKNRGILVFEMGFDQGRKIKELMEKGNFRNINILKDLQGLDRVITGELFL
ncbi:peptide chain release factor N(5)-glutamine methyltransferase [Acidilutibacter cellobiosedens]|uniref:Release factor glutamine methyltransferase n=1 Tax=Acidilutibacter cellobiosedens TaxID=2507161 RepID=A0A410Q9I9_9FIRM|nr:peptide chain release factor N(5)-glutamine methyltransferase [Acidilutibacter cellobiosedens]MBE6081827.1 peptide chain release factor N(5)-glutamine methyltransferase [Tissierellaceae bacterium]QAT60650.1 peptide chain release factor N(5)-glutamine methyltransferase [Acidilutibacter cellobiosedens]